MPLARVGEWRGRTVEVTAHLIPRCLWTTASIDIYLDSGCVLRTGGKLAAVGSVSAEFYESGANHQIELRWGRGQLFCFPIEVTIDGELIARSNAHVDNWPLALWPAVAVAGLGSWWLWHTMQARFGN